MTGVADLYNAQETMKGFDCCMEIPQDCESCPFHPCPEFQPKTRFEVIDCRRLLAFNIRYWLKKAKDGNDENMGD